MLIETAIADNKTYSLPATKSESNLKLHLKLTKKTPVMAIITPIPSFKLNLSFNKSIAKSVTKAGEIFPKNETIAGFSINLMAIKKDVVAIISINAKSASIK